MGRCGKIAPYISHRFPLEGVEEAFRAIADRQVVGKAVLTRDTYGLFGGLFRRLLFDTCNRGDFRQLQNQQKDQGRRNRKDTKMTAN